MLKTVKSFGKLPLDFFYPFNVALQMSFTSNATKVPSGEGKICTLMYNTTILSSASKYFRIGGQIDGATVRRMLRKTANAKNKHQLRHTN